MDWKVGRLITSLPNHLMNDDTKANNLSYYLQQRWAIFPCHWVEDGKCSCKNDKCKSPGKHPLTANGFHDATTDPATIKTWHEKYRLANWATRTGDTRDGGSGLVVVDIDVKSGGPATWEQLREEHSEPLQTVTVNTGGGGNHLFFKYPVGQVIKSRTGAWPGIDIRANGGYVIIPPSQTTGRYMFELSPADNEIEDLPDWILTQLDGHPKPGAVETPTIKSEDPEVAVDNLKSAYSMLNALKKERTDDYQQWLEVGMSLYGLGQDGLVAWDTWSKQSEKYEPGACAAKWLTFTPALQDANRITFGSLTHWAEEDDCAPFIRPAPRKTKPSHYAKALAGLGYEFSCNDMNDMIYLNGNRMSDLLMSKLMTGLREFDYKSKDIAQDVISSNALEHKFHPIKDYLNNLTWEGWPDGDNWHGVDHITNLCEYFKDKDGVFPHIFRAWVHGRVSSTPCLF
jgi:hypothetical protein